MNRLGQFLKPGGRELDKSFYTTLKPILLKPQNVAWHMLENWVQFKGL